uniref:NADP-dependent oxidoreductase domain-containing protein n=1 Tax=Callithrix jacchus TaxID=9483 RepID=A0A5F4WC46_CALJA
TMTALKQSHSVRLNDGHFLRKLGCGTYAPDHISKSQAAEATKVALDVGFCHIDSAYLYQNEEEVGQAVEKITDGITKREDVFYTTKPWATFFQPEYVRPAPERSLKKLGLHCVDLFMIHVPFAMKGSS